MSTTKYFDVEREVALYKMATKEEASDDLIRIIRAFEPIINHAYEAGLSDGRAEKV